MALIPNVGRKAPSIRAFIIFVYASLIVLGATMIVPFLITLTGSTTNDFDYDRFWPVPRYVWSAKDRFVKGLVYFFNGYRGWPEQMSCYVRGTPKHWSNWSSVGRDVPAVDRLATPYLAGGGAAAEGRAEQCRQRLAADYAEFTADYPLSDTIVTVINPQAVNFMQAYYSREVERKFPERAASMSRRDKRRAALDLIGDRWGLPYESFYNINFDAELSAPMDFQGWFPPLENPKFQNFLQLKDAYRAQMFTPGVKNGWLRYLKRHGYRYDSPDRVFPVMTDAPPELQEHWARFKAEHAPASPCIPYALRAAWYKFLQNEEAAKLLQLPPAAQFTIDIYNQAAGTTGYERLEQTPFPIPASFAEPMQKLYRHYIETAWPLRLTRIEITPELEQAYHKFLEQQIKHLRVANELLGGKHEGWSGFQLTPAPPPANDEIGRNQRGVWANFVKSLPAAQRQLSCSEIAYQQYLLDKYGSLDEINRRYGWRLEHIEEAFPPFMAAYATTFGKHQWAFTFQPILRNYKVIAEYLLINANAVPVTLLLISLTILCTLTINPLAAYSMSRFNLRGKELVLLFMLATMAFPAMVSAIPAYLLMRDLGLLNTFFALVLPGAANGMAIFILKGFFDSLPPELFEAATIDGASEAQIFRIVAMPMVKPILAINSLTAFIAAYNGWQWALIVCQDKSMWTIAVWLYQANSWWSNMPWIVSAGFIVASIPTFLVFMSCQKIILRGIIIPSMK